MGFSYVDALFLLGMLAVMWMLIIQPKRREQQALTRMFAALKKGDRVLTHSGMYGEISSIKDQVVTLRFHDNVRIDFDRTAIAKALDGEAALAQNAKDSKAAAKEAEKKAEEAKA
jgi:preprotein translocase subunit YajC